MCQLFSYILLTSVAVRGGSLLIFTVLEATYMHLSVFTPSGSQPKMEALS